MDRLCSDAPSTGKRKDGQYLGVYDHIYNEQWDGKSPVKRLRTCQEEYEGLRNAVYSLRK